MKFFKRKDQLSQDLDRVDKWLSPQRIKVHYMPHEVHIPVTVRKCQNGRYEYQTIENRKEIGRTL